MKRITVEELEQNFDQYVEEVETKKESFVFEYNGKDLMKQTKHHEHTCI
jgi:hypothetical protein